MQKVYLWKVTLWQARHGIRHRFTWKMSSSALQPSTQPLAKMTLLARAIRKPAAPRSKRVASGKGRERCPDVKHLPKGLWAPLHRLVRSRPPIALQKDSRRRPLFDWDAWARQHLTRGYWEDCGVKQERWPTCVRSWAAIRVHNDFKLVATSDVLVRSIVTVTVAETLAYQHGLHFHRLNLNVRRHINTVANRQREDAPSKLTMFHVVQLALARYDYDLLLHKLTWAPEHATVLRCNMQKAFSVLQSQASDGAEPSVLRGSVVALTSALQSSVRGFLFLSWYEPVSISLSNCSLIEHSARVFVTSLPALDTAFLVETPLSPFNSQLTAWIAQLDSRSHNNRWNALERFFRAYCLRMRDTCTDDPREKFSFSIMAVLLSMGSRRNEDLIENIATVAAAHSKWQPQLSQPLIFRGLLELKFNSATRLSCSTDQVNVFTQRHWFH